MRQSAVSLLSIFLAALVPGCALFGGGARRDVVIHDTDKVEVPADPPVDHIQAPASVKLLQAPNAPADARPNIMGINSLGPGKPSRGSIGIATIDDLLDPAGIKNTSAQGPTPPPAIDCKCDLAGLTRATEYMLRGEHPKALQELKVYDEQTQEFYLQILPLMTILAKTPIKDLSPQQIAVMNDLLLRLRETLRPRCELLVDRMTFCREIQGYGQFVPLPDTHAFLNATRDRPGERVQLYVELKNFASVKGKDGMYLTKLACSLELKDANDKRVGDPVRFDENDTTYRRSACLNDYHGNFSFCVPAIPPGTYKLVLQIVDETIPKERRFARKALDFRVTPVASQGSE